MKINIRVIIMVAVALLFGTCSDPKKDKVEYEIASPVYVALAQKSLDFLVSFKYDSFAEMLSDSIEYEVPDGKKLIGKKAVVDYWQNFKNTTGLKSMMIVNANYLPIDNHVKPKGDEQDGVKVWVDFTNKMIFEEQEIAIKMNFNFHFNKAKMIDRMTTFYDSSKIQKP